MVGKSDTITWLSPSGIGEVCSQWGHMCGHKYFTEGNVSFKDINIL